MISLQHFQQYKLRYEVAGLFLYFFINSTLLATSVVMEAQRKSSELPFYYWEPFIWEYSSAISILLLFPFLIYIFKNMPFNWKAIKASLLTYFIASVIFSFCHVGIMVAIREIVYSVMSMNYDFGDFWFEMLYEYRKDVWSFIFFILAIHAYRFILSRLQGEANPIAEGELVTENTPEIERLIVKKLGKEFIINVNDVQWLESSGNYVNLHIEDRIYPLRATMGKLCSQLNNKGFCRIHRSYAVKMDAIESITPLSSGDSEIKLHCGKALNLSRRYKDEFKAQLT